MNIESWNKKNMLNNKLPALHPKLTPPWVDTTEHKGSTYMLTSTHVLKMLHDVVVDGDMDDDDCDVDVSIFICFNMQSDLKIDFQNKF